MKIRKFAVFAAALALAATPAWAQKSGTAVSTTYIGPFAGVNFSTVSGNDFTDAQNQTGFMAGGLLEHVLPSGLFFRIGAKYATRGTQFSDSGSTPCSLGR